VTYWIILSARKGRLPAAHTGIDAALWTIPRLAL